MRDRQAAGGDATAPATASVGAVLPGAGQGVVSGSWLGRLWTWFPRRSLLQASGVIAAQGFSSITNFFAGAVLARACSQAEYGVYVQCIVCLTILSGIDMSLTGYPYTILRPQHKGSRQRTYLGSTLVLQLGILGAIALSFLFVGMGLSFMHVSSSLVRTIYVMAVAGPVFLARDVVIVMVLADLRIWRNLLMVAGASVATIAGLAFCYATHRLTVPVSFVVFTLCTGAPVAAMLYFDLWKDGDVRRGDLREDVGANWRLGKWLAARTLAHTGAVSIFPFLLASFHGSAQTAVYGVCMTYSNLINPLYAGISSFFRPRAAHVNAAHPGRLRQITALCVLALSILLAVFLFTTVEWGDTIMGVLFGAKYRHPGVILTLAVLANCVWVLSTPISIAIDVRQRTDATFRGRLAGCAVSCVVGTIAVWLWGPVGAVSALILANVSTCLYWLRDFLVLCRPALASQEGRSLVPVHESDNAAC